MTFSEAYRTSTAAAACHRYVLLKCTASHQAAGIVIANPAIEVFAVLHQAPWVCGGEPRCACVVTGGEQRRLIEVAGVAIVEITHGEFGGIERFGRQPQHQIDDGGDALLG